MNEWMTPRVVAQRLLLIVAGAVFLVGLLVGVLPIKEDASCGSAWFASSHKTLACSSVRSDRADHAYELMLFGALLAGGAALFEAGSDL